MTLIETSRGNVIAIPESPQDFIFAINEYLPLIKGRPVEALQICRVPPAAVEKNVLDAVTNLCAPDKLERIKVELPLVCINDLQDLPRLAVTFQYASRNHQPAGRDLDLDRCIQRCRELNQLLDSQLDTLRLMAIVKPVELDPLSDGKGIFDSANDLLCRVAIIRRHWGAIGDRMLVTEADLEEGRKVADYVKLRVSPNTLKRSPAPRAEASTRDLLFTLLWERYEVARRAACWLWGDDRDLYVPPLTGRTRRAARAENKPGDKQKTDTVGPQPIRLPSQPVIPLAPAVPA